MSAEPCPPPLSPPARQVPKIYKRAYKACIPCRKNKARCEVDDTSEACIRCRRERKECVFTAERSTKQRRSKSQTTVPSLSARHSGNRRRDSPKAGCDEGTLAGSDNVRRSNSSNQTSSENHDNIPVVDSGVRGQAHSNIHNDVMKTVVLSSNDALGLLFKAAEQNDTDDSDVAEANQADVAQESPISALTTSHYTAPTPIIHLSNPSQAILDLWSCHRFFRNLSPLSTVADSFYADHTNHKRLILEEPLLCCTILMISSRYHILPGQGGQSRADFIHIRLWKHCEHLIQRITFGAEKYSIGKTRTVGSIHALLLITEWHPRALHFPPDGDGWDASLAPSIDDSFGQNSRSDEDIHLTRWREEVFEPAKRSDRMSWMLLGLATTLAHELGVFESADVADAHADSISLQRSLRARRLLFLYVNSLALRLGCSSILPQSTVHSISFTPSPTIAGKDRSNYDRDMMISKWIEVTKLLKSAADLFFPSTAVTRQLLKTGRYIDLLEHFQPLLTKWYAEYNALEIATVSQVAKMILLIDYYYVRMYIFSLSIQALVERATTRGAADSWPGMDFLRNEYAHDYKFNNEVREAACEILSITIRLGETGDLRFCPVRVFLRIVSASIFLLKSISVGTRTSDLYHSLNILDRCNHTLKHTRHDDIHLSARYATLIERHVRRFRKNFRLQSGFHSQPAISNTAALQRTPLVPEPLAPPSFGASSQQIGIQEVMDDYNLDPRLNAEDWFAQPFDPSFAPFGLDQAQSGSVLNMESGLDFLWNLPQ